MKKSTFGLIIIVTTLTVTYFVLSLYFFPKYYLAHTYLSHPKPFIKDFRISNSAVSLGEPFHVSIAGGNNGSQADIQIISIALPSLTNIKRGNEVKILSYNFSQKPLIVEKGDSIGSRYEGQSKTIAAEYPSIQFYSRPWKSGMVYGAQLELYPLSKGKFTMLIKTVTLPNTDSSSHYPNAGIRDYQDEYVNEYQVSVK